MTLPRLYKTTKTSATQICDISVEGGTVSVTFGQLDGKLQTQTTVCTSKNIGRSNETTAEEQAILEAKSKHTKKLKSGYSLTPFTSTDRVQAMKVKVLQDQEHNVIYPCYSTFKYNGVCAIFKRENDTITIYSRTGEIYPTIPHLILEISMLMDDLNSNELNAELYIHGEHLQDIMSAVKKPNYLSSKLTAQVFDICDTDQPYTIRRDRLFRASLSVVGLSHTTCIFGVECTTREDIEQHYNLAILKNYEGTVIKNSKALYQHGTRSSDMFKYKKTLDAEFKIVSHEVDKNNEVVWIFELPHTTFKAKPTGTREYRQMLAANATDYYGTYWTVEYETLSKDGIPLKPVCTVQRTCTTEGDPLE